MRLSRARRAVQDESLVVYRFIDSLQLGRIGNNRQYDICRRQFLIHVGGIYFFSCGIPFYLSVDEARNNFILSQFIGIVVDIIPHDKLVKGEYSQDSLFFHVPFALVLNAVSDNGVDKLDVYTAFISQQRVQSGDGDPEVLAEHFQQGDIHHRFLLT